MKWLLHYPAPNWLGKRAKQLSYLNIHTLLSMSINNQKLKHVLVNQIFIFLSSSQLVFSSGLASCNRQSLFIGLSRMLVFVLIFALRTVPLESGNVWTILPISQELRGEELSAISTTSPAAKFLLGRNHFCRSWRSGMYSRIHLVQNRSARYWTCFQRLLEYVSSLLKMPGGMLGWDFSSNKWLGVRGSRSFGSSETLVSGLLLMMLSTSHMIVCRQSSFTACSFNRELRILRTVRICLSQTPPWWEAAGLLNIHLIPLGWKAFSILSLSSCWTASLNSLSAATKFVPLSLRMTVTCPLLQVKRRIALMQESVSRLSATSICTALRARQVNNTPYCFC